MHSQKELYPLNWPLEIAIHIESHTQKKRNPNNGTVRLPYRPLPGIFGNTTTMETYCSVRS
jgi:hypothetical protein